MGEQRPAELALGTIIDGRYEINAVIGRGGMGEVYRARQVSLDTQVALKVLQRSLAGDEEQVQRFSREAMACSRLKHPNTIRVIDFGRAGSGHLYLAMELLEGRTLSRVLRQEAPLDPLRVLRIALQVTKSIGEAHELGLVHRDLKPGNLFLCDIHGESDFVKVLDFGIAKFMQAEAPNAALTRADVIIGTPLYLSPEQASSRPITPRTDLYSLGVIMYHMVSGAPPFRGDSPVALLMKHMTEAPPPLDARRPGLVVPAELEALIFDLLEKEPERRPESAGVVGQRLQEMLSTSLRPARPTPPPAPRESAEEPDDLVLDDEDDDLDLTGFGVDEEPATAKEPARATAAPAAAWEAQPVIEPAASGVAWAAQPPIEAPTGVVGPPLQSAPSRAGAPAIAADDAGSPGPAGTRMTSAVNATSPVVVPLPRGFLALIVATVGVLAALIALLLSR